MKASVESTIKKRTSKKRAGGLTVTDKETGKTTTLPEGWRPNWMLTRTITNYATSETRGCQLAMGDDLDNLIEYAESMRQLAPLCIYDWTHNGIGMVYVIESPYKEGRRLI